MKKPIYQLGDLLKINGNVSHKTTVGYVCGIKMATRTDQKTREESDEYCYMLSADDNWYWENALTKTGGGK